MGNRQPQPPARSAGARGGRRVRLSRRLRSPGPPWVRAAGGEWFFRLCTQPRRLWRRYVVQVAQFLGLLTLQVTRLRVFPGSAISGEGMIEDVI